MSKPHLLAVFSQLPLPEFSGDRQMVNNHLKNLSIHFQIHAVIICIEKPTEACLHFLKGYTFSYKIFHVSKLRMYGNVFFSMINGEPIQVGLFYQNSIQKYILEVSKQCQVLFCCNIRTAKYLLPIPKVKCIDWIDSISHTYERSIEKVTSQYWKLIYKLEFVRLRRFEENVVKLFDASFFVNHNEHLYWKKYSGNPHITWVPNGIKDHLFEYHKIDTTYSSDGIVFLGKMDYQPNIDAVLWFLDNVLSLLHPHLIFYVAGARPSPKIVNRAKSFQNVVVTGYLEDPYIILNSCIAVISPMQTGGGVQNKILEGMALGKVNIVTSLGGSSIYMAEAGKHYLVADDPVRMADTINEVFQNPKKFEEIGHEARRFVKSHYTWTKHGEAIYNTISQISSV